MKLIFCTKCQDLIRLLMEERTCKCGKSKGLYVDDLNAEIEGPCIPLGFANSSFFEALLNQPEKDWGKEFTAFVIQRECPTIKIRGRNKNWSKDLVNRRERNRKRYEALVRKSIERQLKNETK